MGADIEGVSVLEVLVLRLGEECCCGGWVNKVVSWHAARKVLPRSTSAASGNFPVRKYFDMISFFGPLQSLVSSV